MQLRLRRIPVDMNATDAPILEAPVVVLVVSGAEDPTLAVLELYGEIPQADDYEGPTLLGWLPVPLV